MLDFTHDDWKARAATLTFRNQAFIGGRFVDAADGDRFDCVNPATGAVLARVASCKAADVDAAVAAARKAFGAGHWSRAAPGERKAVRPCLHRLDGGGQVVHAICRPIEHESGVARDRRQEPEPDLRRLP